MAQDTLFLIFSLTIDYGERVATPKVNVALTGEVHSSSPLPGRS